MDKAKAVIIGLLLIVVGGLLGARALDLISFDIFFDGWWTLFIIIPCTVTLITERDKLSSSLGLLLGVMLLLAAQDIISFDTLWKLLIPFALVVGGAALIITELFNSEISGEIKKLKKKNSDTNECTATFSGQDVNFNGKKFAGANLSAIFGGIKYRLDGATIDEDVVINCSSIFGGVDDHTSQKAKKGAKIIYVNATCVFGGVDVK